MYALSFLETRGVLPLELQAQVERGECNRRRDRRMKNGAVLAPAAVPTSVSPWTAGAGKVHKCL